MTDDELRARMEASLVASWAALAAAVPGARVEGRAAVFPDEPHRAIYANALAGPGGAEVDAALRAYAEAGVERYAIWVAEGDDAALALVRERGLAFDTATRAMALDLAAAAADAAQPEVFGSGDAATALRINGLDPSLMDGTEFGVLVAALDGHPAAALMHHDHDGDRTIFNVATLEPARGRGLATVLTAAALRDARAAGCATASLQASAMAERLYARLGFRDLGRFLEFVPAGAA